jgi:hypothetical protein
MTWRVGQQWQSATSRVPAGDKNPRSRAAIGFIFDARVDGTIIV